MAKSLSPGRKRHLTELKYRLPKFLPTSHFAVPIFRDLPLNLTIFRKFLALFKAAKAKSSR